MAEHATPRGVIPKDREQDAVAIMVHGTYASAVEDSGELWWQSDSPCSRRLQSFLPSFIRPTKEKEVFHWSGENSERARSKAAARLLQHLRSLEDQGQDYHLVGHSHGGSVIWNALQMSVLTKRPLRKLGSWTTVGTPFMHHRSRGRLSIINLMALVLGLVLLLPAMGAPKQLITTLYNIAIDNRAAVVLEPDHAVGYASILRTPVLALVECFGIAVDRQPEGVHVGSFDPAGGQSLAQYFFVTPEGLFLLFLMVALSYVFIHCAVLCISPVIESHRIRLEQRLHRSAFEEYGASWLGIWSPDDEAINGLRATLDISVSFVSKTFPREVVYLSDTFALLSRPYYWLFAPLYNRFVHPAIDGKVRSIVVRAAQGNDRPTATLAAVTPYPAGAADCSPPPLPALLNLRLVAFANKHAHDLVPKLRSLIANNSFTSGLEAFGRQLSGSELVHTAYFEQDEILKLVAANMTWEATAAENSDGLQAMPPWLRKWFITFKAAVGQVPTERSEIGETHSMDRTEPQRRKAA